jgi:hypothetical protein
MNLSDKPHCNWNRSRFRSGIHQNFDAANYSIRPWGHTVPTPDDRWHTREPLGDAARTSFRTLLATNQREVRQEMNHTLDVVLDHYPQAAVDRIATQRALVTQGLLKMSRRLINLPLKQLKLAMIL